MRTTYTLADLPCPIDVVSLFREVFEEVGQEDRISIAPTGEVSLDMTGIALVPDPDQGLFLVSGGTLSDHDVGLGQEAFTAGYRAAVAGEDLAEAWSNFTPDLSLYEEASRFNKDAS